MQVWTTLLLICSISPSLGCQASNDTVVGDMWNAFRAISNDSALLERVIPEMYGASMYNTDSKFVFELPAARGAKSNIVTMKRCDFADPIFPRVSKVAPRSQPDNSSYVKHALEIAPAAEWQRLGLDGWTGELKQPEYTLEQSHKQTQQQVEYSRQQLLLDKQLNGRVTDIRIIPSDRQETDNVYIGRANDPFGYSVKWDLRTQSNRTARQTRSVLELYCIIQCANGCSPLYYKRYGCYCGLGGRGAPVDEIDRCCQRHDKCYLATKCGVYVNYFVPYIWKCHRGEPICSSRQGPWSGQHSCPGRLCECDRQLALCLRKYKCPRRSGRCPAGRFP
ncbi:hypothetical protein KR222_005106 [Zaprionus bogoriensis]|nr:hypothetical protein KR222_005106 [Zaprionus bogoriensis]